jgi:hypothetical protein
MKKQVNDNDLLLEELLALRYEITKPINDPELFKEELLLSTFSWAEILRNS